MSDHHLYRHRETGIVADITDRVAAIFGDHLELVEVESPKAIRKKKKTADSTETDSSEGGNE